MKAVRLSSMIHWDCEAKKLRHIDMNIKCEKAIVL